MAINQTNVRKEGKDPMSNMLAGKINGLYYYYLEPGLYSTLTFDDGTPVPPGTKIPDNTSILGTTDAICNVAYVPFMSVSDGDLIRVPYDSERFGKINRDEGPETSNSANFPFVFRLKPQNPLGIVKLTETALYPTIEKPSIGTTRNYRYESRLYDYPYRSIVFASNIFDEVEIIPANVYGGHRIQNKVELYAQTAINPGGNFFTYVEGYKGDSLNYTERNYSSASMDLPNTSSAYSNYMATQKAQTNANVKYGIIQGGMKMALGITAGATGITDPFTATGMIAGGMADMAATKSRALAKKEDLYTTPNSLKSIGGDMICRLGKQKETYVIAYQRIIHEEYRMIIGDYFAYYGYKQNKVMIPNLRSRHYYNYIKTVGANIQGKGVPKKHMTKLKMIFDKGITLWHVDRNGGLYCDYKYDNTEV